MWKFNFVNIQNSKAERWWHPKHVEQLSDKINSVTCASSWDLYFRILKSKHTLCSVTCSQNSYRYEISLYLIDRASFINSFYFFFQLDTLIFSFFLHLQFFSTCFGPAGPSSGESNVYLHVQPLAPFLQSLMCRASNTNGHARHINDGGNDARGCLCN